jgi:hypothetical protein
MELDATPPQWGLLLPPVPGGEEAGIPEASSSSSVVLFPWGSSTLTYGLLKFTF